jgi:hypothetical protein
MPSFARALGCERSRYVRVFTRFLREDMLAAVVGYGGRGRS